MQQLSQFEHAVMSKLLSGEHPTLAILRSQLDKAQVASRRWTGAGFYCDFALPDAVLAISSKVDFRISDVIAQIPGLRYGAGFVLFVRSGKLRQLEGYSYDELWSSEPKTFRLQYGAEPRVLNIPAN